MILLKTLGVCFLTQLSADSCRDAGEGALAAKVELAGKLFIVILALPLFQQNCRLRSFPDWRRSMKKKLFLLIFLILSAILFGGVQVHAAGEEGASSLDEYYQEQMETSGANDLWDELPGDTQNSLENLGVTSPDWQSIQNLARELCFRNWKPGADPGKRPSRRDVSGAVCDFALRLNGGPQGFLWGPSSFRGRKYCGNLMRLCGDHYANCQLHCGDRRGYLRLVHVFDVLCAGYWPAS